MESQIWVVSTLLISIVLIVLTIVKLKFHPFLALLLASFFVGAMMGMGPLEMVNAIESGIGGTLGFLAAVWTAVGGAYVHYKQEEVRHLYVNRKR